MGVNMKDVTREMIRIYKLKDHDWLNFKIVKMNEITFHHIKKDEDGGKCIISNGALLTEKAHQYLHCIERHDLDIYNEINRVFKEINEQGYGPTQNQYDKIELLFLKFECKHSKILVKGKFKQKKREMIAINNRIRNQNS